jgi:hypothetical protein
MTDDDDVEAGTSHGAFGLRSTVNETGREIAARDDVSSMDEAYLRREIGM